jgi:hypothetical protein
MNNELSFEGAVMSGGLVILQSPSVNYKQGNDLLAEISHFVAQISHFK